MKLSLEYRWRLAEEEYKNGNPTIIMLHGIGSNMDDLYSFSHLLPKKYNIFSAQAPIEYSIGGYAWYHIEWTGKEIRIDFEEVLRAKDKVSHFIDELINNYNVDKDNIYLLGFSQGCILSYTLSLTEPNKVKGIAGLSGYLMQDTLNLIEDKNNLSHLDYFIAHGRLDDVIPLKKARESIEAIKDLPIKVNYKEYDMPHGINQECMNDLINWFNKV